MLAWDLSSFLGSVNLSTSVHSTGFSSLTNANFNTSSAVSTGKILISSFTFWGMSIKSFSFSFGIKTFLTPLLWAANSFSFNPPIGKTWPVTVTGQVLPIGGLKEKLLAAHRAGVKKVLIPKENEKDLADIPKKVKEDIKIIPVETANEVIKIALVKELKPIEWTDVDKITESKKDEKSQASIQ